MRAKIGLTLRARFMVAVSGVAADIVHDVKY